MTAPIASAPLLNSSTLACDQRHRVEHLYIHIPFCTHICPYCAFHKERNLTPAMNAFIPALITEWHYARNLHDITPRTVFIGGGTPSALSISQIKRLMESLDFGQPEEFTIEANPATITPAKAALLRQWGINRVSLGVQSFDPAMLKLLGRTHNHSQVASTIRILREADIPAINIDLMFSLPGQSPDLWSQTLDKALALQPDHISTYNLTYEEDTEFLQRLQRGEFHTDESADRDMYLQAVDRLQAAGWLHYETSNFARPGSQCLHNQAIWRGENYLGLGPSACSTIHTSRIRNIPDTMAWATSLQQHGYPQQQCETLTPHMRHLEILGTSLRTDTGLPLTTLHANDDAGTMQTKVHDLTEAGFLEVTPQQRLRLTRKGKPVADSVIAWLI